MIHMIREGYSFGGDLSSYHSRHYYNLKLILSYLSWRLRRFAEIIERFSESKRFFICTIWLGRATNSCCSRCNLRHEQSFERLKSEKTRKLWKNRVLFSMTGIMVIWII